MKNNVAVIGLASMSICTLGGIVYGYYLGNCISAVPSERAKRTALDSNPVIRDIRDINREAPGQITGHPCPQHRVIPCQKSGSNLIEFHEKE